MWGNAYRPPIHKLPLFHLTCSAVHSTTFRPNKNGINLKSRADLLVREVVKVIVVGIIHWFSTASPEKELIDTRRQSDHRICDRTNRPGRWKTERLDPSVIGINNASYTITPKPKYPRFRSYLIATPNWPKRVSSQQFSNRNRNWGNPDCTRNCLASPPLLRTESKARIVPTFGSTKYLSCAQLNCVQSLFHGNS
ncbi:hypothetical protein EDF61_11077 [Arthrobacter sp. JUb115]|nr:hypothetical protein EDF61_11077 [Arthrobacter sp. JUb115]